MNVRLGIHDELIPYVFMAEKANRYMIWWVVEGW